MSDLVYLGKWDPLTGSYPIIPDEITAGYFFASSANTVEGHDFEVGDWLIYLEENNVGTYYQSNGGIVQLTTLETTANTDPGVYTKVVVNNAGIVTRGEELEESDIPTHSHNAEDITDLADASKIAASEMFSSTENSRSVEFEYDAETKAILADVKVDNETIYKNEFGQLTCDVDLSVDVDDLDIDRLKELLGSETVELNTFNSGTLDTVKLKIVDNNVTAAIAVDDETITINEYGQLTSVAEVSVDVNDLDIDALRELLDIPNIVQVTYVSSNTDSVVFETKDNNVSGNVRIDGETIQKNQYGQLVAISPSMKAHTHNVDEIEGLDIDLNPAPVQLLTLPTAGTYEDGQNNLINVSIRDAFHTLNLDIKEVYSVFTNMTDQLGGLVPEGPKTLNEIELLTDEVLVDAIYFETGENVLATENTFPKIYTERFGATGSLTGTIDNLSETATITEENNTGEYGVLRIVENFDLYEGFPAFQGWHESLKAQLLPPASLDEGFHTFALESNGEKAELELYTSIKPLAPIAHGNILFYSDTLSRKYTSGVPSYLDPVFTLESFDIERAFKEIYNKNAANIYYEDELVLTVESDIESNKTAVETFYEALDATLRTSKTLPKTLSLPEGVRFDSDVMLTIKALDILGNEGIPYAISTKVNIDDSIENRVTSGLGLFPDECGLPFESFASIADSQELQLLNENYIYPVTDYTPEGPDYSDLPGLDVDGKEYRFATFKFSELDIQNLDIEIEQNAELTFNHELSDYIIYIKIVGETGWVNANKPYKGYGSVINDDDGALDLNVSTPTLRRVTYGTRVGTFSGNILVRVGITKDSSPFKEVKLIERQ